MVATYNNAILGPPLKVGVIASANSTPNFSTSQLITPMDGGLISQQQPNILPLNYQCNWIGPDGTYASPILKNLIEDGYDTPYGGIYFDPIYDTWVSIGGNTGKRLSGNIGTTFCNNGAFTYKSFAPKLVANALNYTGFFSQSTVNMHNGFGCNFFWAGKDRIGLSHLKTPIVNNGITIYNYTASVSVPYGLLNYNLPSVVISSSISKSPPNPSFVYWVIGPVYRQTDYSGLFLAQPDLFNRILCKTDFAGNFKSTSYSGPGPQYTGRLFNGFVFTDVFNNYHGCVYTEDFVTFYPLLDITNTIDFSNGFFGIRLAGHNTFNSAFGFSYLANYNNVNNPGLTQAAYKIYPAFNFTPMVPDSFFIPSVCGCNRRSNRA